MKKRPAGGIGPAAKDAHLYPSGGLAVFLYRTLNQECLEIGVSGRTRRRWVLASTWHSRLPCPLEQGEKKEPNSDWGLETTNAQAARTNRWGTTIVKPFASLEKSLGLAITVSRGTLNRKPLSDL